MTIIQEMVAHACEIPLEEVCGLVVTNGTKSKLLKGSNIAQYRHLHFDMDPEVFLRVPEGWEVIASYHSHPSGTVTPSEADRVTCEASRLPMYIVSAFNNQHFDLKPNGYRAPYERRPYVLGVLDCWSLVKDWYRWELGIDVPAFDNERQPYSRGESVYVRNIEAAGFVDIGDMPVQHGDLMLIQVGPTGPNHAAIWLEGGRILHHVTDRVSKQDHWAGYWVQHMTHHLRHKQRL